MGRFDDLYDVEDLKKNLEEIKQNGTGDFPEIPVGKYEVKVEKIELGASKAGAPMGKIQFRIVEGDYKKSCLFYNQVLVGKNKETGELTTFGLHNFNQFLKSLAPSDDIEVVFEDFDQYADLLLDIAEDVETLTYDVQYGKNGDYPTFKVLRYYEN